MTTSRQSGNIKITPVTAQIGAMVSGVDLRDELDDDVVSTLRAGLIEHLVLFFRQQHLTPPEQYRFAEYFSPVLLPYIDVPSTEVSGVTVLDQSKPRGVSNEHWHSDSTNLPQPPMGGLLRAVMIPERGGDTCWASMYAAYDALSPAMQKFLKGLTAEHSTAILDAELARYPQVVRRDQTIPPSHHPVIRQHAETGRNLLFVNRNFTVRIDGLSAKESDALLQMLFAHIQHPEFHVRFHWEVGSVALWDNRATQHCALSDYTARRIMNRCMMVGETPMAAA